MASQTPLLNETNWHVVYPGPMKDTVQLGPLQMTCEEAAHACLVSGGIGIMVPLPPFWKSPTPPEEAK